MKAPILGLEWEIKQEARSRCPEILLEQLQLNFLKFF